jgi:hypothetical protein
VGKACVADTDCGAIATCSKKQGFGTFSSLIASFGIDVELDAPGGYCTASCSKDADCGQGSVCLGAVLGVLRGECRKSCSANTDCRAPDYECAKQMLPASDAGAAAVGAGAAALAPQCQALPKTNHLTDNQTGLACETTPDAGVSPCGDGFCFAGACTGVCVKDSDCGSNAACIPTGVLPGSGGTCQETCNVDSDCARYGKAGLNIGCVASDSRKLCTQKSTCENNSQCPTGTVCTERTFNGMPAKVCGLPPRDGGTPPAAGADSGVPRTTDAGTPATVDAGVAAVGDAG